MKSYTSSKREDLTDYGDIRGRKRPVRLRAAKIGQDLPGLVGSLRRKKTKSNEQGKTTGVPGSERWSFWVEIDLQGCNDVQMNISIKTSAHKSDRRHAIAKGAVQEQGSSGVVV